MNKLEQLREYKAKIALGGGQDKIDAQHKRGKLTARERLDILFDEGSFVEIDTFVTNRSNNFDMPEKKFHGDGVVTGYSTVDSRLVFAFSQDFTVIGGSLGEYHAEIVKVQNMALKMGAPLSASTIRRCRVEEGVNAVRLCENFQNNTISSGVIPRFPLSWDHVPAAQYIPPPSQISFSWWTKPARCSSPAPRSSRL
jgi:acetyl-CoA carboxylase carboxyltransferase component